MCAVGRSSTANRRDDAALVRGLSAWGAAHYRRPSWRVLELVRPASGWSNETLLLTAAWDEAGGERQRLVVRLPAIHPVFPVHDPDVEGSVLEALAGTAVPAPAPIAVEHDERWVGAAFVAMAFADGRPGPEAPAFDPWLSELSAQDQRRLHEAFLRALASLHRLEWADSPLERTLRGGSPGYRLADEVEWWSAYVDWATGRDPPKGLSEALAWCAATVPAAPASSLCWGDARLGNALIGGDFGVWALLDWECASIGPAEMDLAWYLALEDVVERLTGRSVPGFLTRDETVAAYEEWVGRPVQDLEWHEIFALVRSVAISERLARLAREGHSGYRGRLGADNPVLVALGRRLEATG